MRTRYRIAWWSAQAFRRAMRRIRAEIALRVFAAT
jgi:hypothetical protein